MKNAVVSVITYPDSSNQGFIMKEREPDPEVLVKVLGVIYKKKENMPTLLPNTHVINGAKR